MTNSPECRGHSTAKDNRGFQEVPKDGPESTMTVGEHGDKVWRNAEGELHNPDGPAIEWAGGGKEYYVHNKRHRPDGPAIDYPDGMKVYYVNGQRHNPDGPAAEYPDGTKEYWLNNVYFATEEEWRKAVEAL